MGSTNKTANLQLSQFVATDKPAWLSDYNGDMSKIDTAYGTLDASVGSYDSRITQVEEKADALTDSNTALTQKVNAMEPQVTANTAAVSTLNGNVSTLQVQVGTLETNVSQAQSTATQAQSTATQAKSEADSTASFLNIVKMGEVTNSTSGAFSTSGCTISEAYVRWALNSDGTFGKVYGNIIAVNTGGGSGNTVKINAGKVPIAVPASEWSLGYSTIAWCSQGANAAPNRMASVGMTIGTDGSITLTLPATVNAGDTVTIVLLAVPNWWKNFGDDAQAINSAMMMQVV